MSVSAQPSQPSPWSQFPAVQHTAPLTTADDVLTILQASVKASAFPLLLVDVRRNDYQGGAIKGSINLPAESFWWNRGELLELCRRAGVGKVAFYCGSSNGRGPRCAGWFADYLIQEGEENVQALTLEGGIKSWVKQGPEFVEAMKGFDSEYWKQFT